MTFKAGQSGNPAGKPKGALSKFNASIKDMILTALQDVGGAKYLARQAEENPAAFMGLVGKVLPTQLTGADGGAIEWVVRIPVESATVDDWLATYAPQHIRDAKRLTQTKETINGEAHDIPPQEPAK